MSDQPFRIIVIANETLPGANLDALVAGSPNVEVLVVAPALNTRVRHWMNDDALAIRRATRRLHASVGGLIALGVDARGEIGDADPLLAAEDALRLFPADHLVVSTHPYGRSNWLAVNLIERLRERLTIPITHLVVESAHLDVPVAA